jgi:hypothetical protein
VSRLFSGFSLSKTALWLGIAVSLIGTEFLDLRVR